MLRLTVLLAALCVGVAVPAAHAGPSFFVGVDEDDGAALAPHGETLRDLGVRAVRVPLLWHFEQSRLDDAQVAELSRLVAATPRSVRIVLLAGGHVTPLDAAARDRFCSFVGDVLERYPAINDVIVWNEPNKSDYWRPQYDADGRSAAPATYVALLARCWDVLHAVRPGVNVVAPATSPRGNDNPNAVSNISHSPLSFIRRMGEAYRASGRTRRLFDTVAHHAYGSTPGERPWRTHVGNQISQGDHQKLLNQLAYAFKGTGQAVPGECKPGGCVWIWYTEAGYQTIPDEAKSGLYSGSESVAAIPDFAGGEPSAPAPAATSTAPDHWTQIHDGIRLARCQAYVQAFFNYLLVDQTDLGRWQSGLLWADATRKRAYDAFRAVAAEAAADRTDCASLKGGPAPRPDVLAPGVAAAPKARPGPRSVTLALPEPPEADVMGHHVFRSERRAGPYVRVTAAPVPGRAFTDRPVTNGRTYWYAISAADTGENEGGRSPAVCATPRATTERYLPRAARILQGTARGGREAARLHRDDGRRVVVAATGRRAATATLLAEIRLPACMSQPRRLTAQFQGAASAAGLRTEIAVRSRSGGWAPLARVLSSRRDAAVARSTVTPRRWMRGRAVTLRVRVTGRAPFTASVDVLRLTARY